MCVCVQVVRSQDLLSLILGHSLRNCMRWMAWHCLLHAQRCVWSRCGFRSLYTNEFWQCLRRMLCASCTSDTHFQRRIVVISVVNSQYVSFRIPPKLIVHLPQSMLECAFNDAYSILSVACVLSGQFRMLVKRWDTDNLVLFRMFSANGYQLMSDEQDVSPYLHFPGIFLCSCNCMCWVAWRRSRYDRN